MKTKILFATSLTLALFTAGYAQTLDKAKLDQFFDRLAERITSKIGLADTYIATGNIDVNKNESLTYLNTGSDWKQMPETHPSILFGAGAIVSEKCRAGLAPAPSVRQRS